MSDRATVVSVTLTGDPWPLVNPSNNKLPVNRRVSEVVVNEVGSTYPDG